MKKLLFQLDTDPYPAAFDTIVAYDGGADHVIGHGNVTPENVVPLVEGAIFTRSPKEKKYTSLFIGGSNMTQGETLLKAVQEKFFADFRVSIMLDSNGGNTTAAAGVAKLLKSGEIKGKKVVVLAGTGPVGQRVAAITAKEGAGEVIVTSRQLSKAERTCADIKNRFDADITPVEATDDASRGDIASDAQIVFAAGAAGVKLLKKEHWENNNNIEMMADANATPPLGIDGVEMMDRGEERHGKIVWGAIGFGALKLELHRRCITKLFESNDLVFDTENIFSLAKTMG